MTIFIEKCWCPFLSLLGNIPQGVKLPWKQEQASGEGSNFISIAVIKYSEYKKPKGERALFHLSLQVTAHHCGESKEKLEVGDIAYTVKRGKKQMHAFLLACFLALNLFSPLFLYSGPPCFGYGPACNELGLPTMSNQDNYPQAWSQS